MWIMRFCLLQPLNARRLEHDKIRKNLKYTWSKQVNKMVSFSVWILSVQKLFSVKLFAVYFGQFVAFSMLSLFFSSVWKFTVLIWMLFLNEFVLFNDAYTVKVLYCSEAPAGCSSPLYRPWAHSLSLLRMPMWCPNFLNTERHLCVASTTLWYDTVFALKNWQTSASLVQHIDTKN